ncbi:hypothetical protein CDV36_014162 [Fusarium kuroshium]|uniref:Uncharacterized protein n=1 Tax=Fusarium kuroshium TaxID=2010991 RepID=A0A3M2RIL1_9HYPO|nr:hypothetical protein CDV36_014162 [Fusarium kuroshium]
MPCSTSLPIALLSGLALFDAIVHMSGAVLPPIAVIRGPSGSRLLVSWFLLPLLLKVQYFHLPSDPSDAQSEIHAPAAIASQQDYCRPWDDKQNEAHWCMLLSAGIDSTQSCVKPRSGSGAYEIPNLIASNRRPEVTQDVDFLAYSQKTEKNIPELSVQLPETR